MLHSDDVPQADELRDVINTAIAVMNGNTTYQSIAKFIRKVDRQGRYYRKAAELLNLLTPTTSNHSEITEFGKQIISMTITERVPYLADVVLKNPACKGVFNLIRNNPNNNRRMLEEYLMREGLTDNMAERRISSILSWLKELDMIREENDKFVIALNETNHAPIIGFSENHILEFDLITEPLSTLEVPINGSDRIVYSSREASEIWDGSFTSGRSFTIAEVDLDLRERALKSHQKLVRLMADNVTKNRGVVSKCNQNIDLFTELSEGNYIFEMKSCTLGNMLYQMRRAVSQLYEYKYKYRNEITNPSLWIVLEDKPNDNDEWYIDYLVNDRKINVCWLTPTNEFICASECEDKFMQLMNK